MNTYPHLFEPGRIGALGVKNRIVMAPMGTTGALVGYRGVFSDRAITYFERRAKGETGLIITGVNLVNPGIEPWEIEGVTMNMAFNYFWKVPNFLQLTERVHDFGTKIFAQLTAGFGRVIPGALAEANVRAGLQPIAPSPMPIYWRPGIMARELSTEEVDGLVHALGKAALIARESEFDGVELHGHEGYLMDQFTTALWNKRTDKYGGDLTGRMHFVLSIIRIIQKMAGPDFPIIYRYGLEHKIPGGRSIDEGIEMAKMLEKEGVAALHVDAGCYDNWFWPHPPVYQPPGCMVDMAERVKQHVGVPVITVGRLGYPDLAESILERGKADFIALGRPLLADPDFAAKARRGQSGEIRPCIGCHECFTRLMGRKAISCAVNPQCADEERLAIRPAAVKKRVMVVGGGIGGLEAARVSALRGHEVTLYEQSDRLGGVLEVAGTADFKKDLADLMRFQVGQVRKLQNISVRLNTEATPEAIRSENPDALFVATGSSPSREVNIRNLSKSQWVTSDDVYRGNLPEGRRACVVGGGSVGCETALYLAKAGWSVMVIEVLADLARDLHEANRVMLLELLKEHGVEVSTESQVTEATPTTVLVSTPRGEKEFPADLLILAIGRNSLTSLAESARELVKETYVIGDCVSPRKVKDAMWEAFKLALNT
jgi:2-enoate reductase